MPAACARVQIDSMLRRWMCMPEANTASAQSKSARVAADMFSSMNRTSQCGGRAAAIVSSPWGGMNALVLSVRW
ncbi:hypothetical protein RHAL1_01944 [Beijerinckiaceae bacterium RH AL1]|nr:hypothetical protein RHAL1_01944 [Beijerinckiaceae bacterium RH AL1]